MAREPGGVRGTDRGFPGLIPGFLGVKRDLQALPESHPPLQWTLIPDGAAGIDGHDVAAPHRGRKGNAVAGMNDTRFLTVAEVTEMMRVSRMTVYRLVHSGDLPAIRFGRSFRVPESAVEVAAANHVVEQSHIAEAG